MSEPIPPFQVFLDEHRALVLRFLLAVVGPQDADDCFQETFMSALRAYPDLRHGRNLRSWVLTIAANKATDAGRSRGRRAVPVDDVAAVAGGRAVDRRTDPQASIPDEGLWRAVRALPPQQRTAVVLRFVLDRPYAEVAEVMGGSTEAARANAYQGVKRLRSSLATTDDGDDGREVATDEHA